MNNIEFATKLNYSKNTKGTAVFRYVGGDVAYVTDIRGNVVSDINLALFSEDAFDSIVKGMGFSLI